MSPEKPKTYTAEFKASSVKLANKADRCMAQTAKDRGININSLYTGIDKYSCPPSTEKAIRTDEHLYGEIKRLKKEMALLTEERDLLIVCR